MKYKSLIFLTTFIISFCSFTTGIKAETVLERINKTGIFRIGMRTDSPPIAYRDLENSLSGSCLIITNLIKEKILQELKRQSLTIQIVESNIENRFDLVANNVVDVECGPNSISNNIKEKIDFSDDFLITSQRLLVTTAEAPKINVDSSLEDKTIGVILYSSTENFIKNKYPLAKIEIFQGETARKIGVQALEQGRIDAFASDGILLLGQVILLGASLRQEYTLIPTIPFSCEKYGLIIPQNDIQWKNLINSVIDHIKEKMNGNQAIIENRFTMISRMMTELDSFCASNQNEKQ